MKCWKFAVCCVTAFALTLPAGAFGASDSVPETIKQDLSKVADTLVKNAAKNIRPNIKTKEVKADDKGGFVACYVEVDASDVQTEVTPSAAPGKYVGTIRYTECQYECPGKNKAEALKAECRMVKSRRIKELISYEKGKWHY